jgi:hypothetical protein
MEMGSPGKILFLFKPEIVIPVPTTTATAVKTMTVINWVWIRALVVNML